MEIGNKVICIDIVGLTPAGLSEIKLDKVYVIEGFNDTCYRHKDTDKLHTFVYLKGLSGLCLLSRFRKVQPKENLINEELASIGVDRIKREREKEPITAPEIEKVFTLDADF